MKVLVVEDEHKIANSIKRGFEQENWVCDVAYDGEQGYDLALSGDYDVLVVDLMLPLITGDIICKNLRSEGIHTPILILTARGELSDKVEGLNNGADDYLVKPFAFEELVARVRALTRRPTQIRNTKLEIRNVTLDQKTMQVRKDNKIVNLSKKEYQLLEYLMTNKGKIISKEDLIAHVWDYDTNILPNTVEVFIGYLRKKVGKEFIKTVRGFGYKL